MGGSRVPPTAPFDPTTSNLRQRIGCAILLCKISIRLFVGSKGLRFGVKSHIAAEVTRNVPKVADRGRKPADFHIRVGSFPALDAIDEVLLVQTCLGLG